MTQNLVARAIGPAMSGVLSVGMLCSGNCAALGEAPEAMLVRYYTPGATSPGEPPSPPSHTLKDLKPGHGPQDTKRIPGGPEEGISGGGAQGDGGGEGGGIGPGWEGGGAGREMGHQ